MKKYKYLTKKELRVREKVYSIAVEKAKSERGLATFLREILHQSQADAILSSIITGELKVKKPLFNPLTKSYEMVEVEPDHTERINAYIQYCKRFGSFAPKSSNISINKNNTLQVEFISPKPSIEIEGNVIDD